MKLRKYISITLIIILFCQSSTRRHVQVASQLNRVTVGEELIANNLKLRIVRS